jgi:L,D-transpeptidase-like protein
MRTAFLPATLLAAALPCAAPAHADILVSIDKSTQRMSVAVDGATRYVWPVSTGRPGYDTPNGTYHPFRMEADHFSKEWDDAPMPHSVFFTKIGHAIHGSLDTKHLGSAASHGCVRLSPEHASTLYALVEAEGLKDTTVVIAGQTPIAEASRRGAPVEAAAGEPLDIAPGYDRDGGPYYSQQPGAYYGQEPAPRYARPPQPYDGQSQQSYHGQPQQPYGGQQPQTYFGRPQPYYAEQSYGQPQT